MSVLLPTGTVNLVLADVEGSTRLWEAQPDKAAVAVAVAQLDRTVTETTAAEDDTTVFEQSVKVAGLVESPTRLLRPSVIRRAAVARRNERDRDQTSTPLRTHRGGPEGTL